MRKPRKFPTLEFTAWIALSDAGYPATFIGLSFSRKDLRRHYFEEYGGDLERDGYRAIKARVVEILNTGRAAGAVD